MTKLIDARGMLCPIPVLKVRKYIRDIAPGETLTIMATDPVAPLDLRHFCQQTGHDFVSETPEDGFFRLVVRRVE